MGSRAPPASLRNIGAADAEEVAFRVDRVDLRSIARVVVDPEHAGILPAGDNARRLADKVAPDDAHLPARMELVTVHGQGARAVQ